MSNEVEEDDSLETSEQETDERRRNVFHLRVHAFYFFILVTGEPEFWVRFDTFNATK